MITGKTPPTTNHNIYTISGTVRGKYQQPIDHAYIRAFDKDIRSEQLLGEALTNEQGLYEIRYKQDQFARTDKTAADVIVRLYNADNSLLKESAVYYNAADALTVDIDLSGQTYTGPSEFDLVTASIKPFTGDLAFSVLTENDTITDISFLANKTALDRDTVETFAMAFRFGQLTQIPAAVYYALMRQNLQGNAAAGLVSFSSGDTFEERLSYLLDGIMHENIDTVMNALQTAIAVNIIPYYFEGQLKAIKEQLLQAMQQYAKQHPQTDTSSSLFQKIQLAGLTEQQAKDFQTFYAQYTGANEDIWTALGNTNLAGQADSLQAVFQLFDITDQSAALSAWLIRQHGITNPSSLSALTVNTVADWEAVLTNNSITPPPSTPGATVQQKTKNYAASLEKNLAGRFPTQAFISRLQQDNQAAVKNKEDVLKTIQDQPGFDLLKTKIGSFTAQSKSPVNAEAAAELKKLQRIFKLAPDYSSTTTLLADNIHSAAQVYKMGRDNFITKYGAALGTDNAQAIYQKALQTHAQAIALAGNLRSLSDASYLNVFPDYTTMLKTLVTEVPDIDTLFGHADYCECDECRSVYGAAAYLADILHYLEFRNSKKTGVNVRQLLLSRRPDIAAIDLNCDNTNTEVPYIDIACELMEDYINPPVILLNNSFLPDLVKGTINNALLSAIQQQFSAAGYKNISNLLTSTAIVSDGYQADIYNGTSVETQQSWIIRDALVVLKATQTNTGIAVLLLHQTLLSSEEISANPEYTNLPVYQDDTANNIKGVLNNAQRPFLLPFDLYETEGELYLEKSGVPKVSLIKTFNKEHDLSGPPSDNDLNVAYTSLMVNESERTLIFREDLVNQTNYWGPMASGTTVAINDFEHASGLQYNDILALISLSFINPGKDILILHDDLSCDTDTQSLIHLSPPAFDRMHRFIRLWRKTTLSMQELDTIIMCPATGNGVIDPAFAVQIYNFIQLQSTWQFSASQLLSFYTDIDTSAGNSLYFQLFQNKYVTNPVNPDFSVANVTAGSMAIASVHEAVISAATGLSPADLDILLANTDGKLSLSNLSFIYRNSLLSQALSFSVNDLLHALDIVNIAPFINPVQTAVFVQKCNTVTTSGFSMDEINYVLRHQNDAFGSLIPADSQVVTSLTALQDAVLKIRAAVKVAPDTKGVLLTKWLTDPLLNWHAALVTRLMDILTTADDTLYQQKIDDNSNFLINLRVQYAAPFAVADLGILPFTDFPPEYAPQVSYDGDSKQIKLIGYISLADKNALTALSADPAYTAAVTNLYNSAQLTDNSPENILFSSVAAVNSLRAITWANADQRFAYFLTAISPVYRQIQQINTVAAQLTAWFTLDKNLSAQLLVSIPAVYSTFTGDDFINKLNPLSSANYPGQFDQYLQLQKIAFIVNKLTLTAADIQWQLMYAADVKSLDYLALPLVAITGPVTTFDTFEALINILKFEQHYPLKTLDATAVPPLTISIYDIFLDAINAKPVADIEAGLIALTTWNADDLRKLVEAPGYLNIQSPADFTSPAVLMRLHNCFTVLQQLSTNADDALAWCKNSLNYDDATKIVQLMKARYSSDEDWLAVTQPLQDQLREKKRDALISYLLANPGTQDWQTDTDLYSYFLLDVEMCACQPTSRIVQATNSVQLFVQRCILSLEKNIVADTDLDSDWNQWEWMKYFRLWQANYKVFLYPENWIEPDLLPVKSSFFTDLQNDLQQNEVTEQNAEDAFMSYLEKLDGVARLEVKGMWYDDPGQTLYVIARTYGGDPKTYYYRQLVEERRWTPWEKIDLDINSDQVIPVVYNNRFYLFWAVFTEQADQPTSLNVPDIQQSNFPLQAADKYWQIQLAYSEYRNGKWSPKKISNADQTGTIIKYEKFFPHKEYFLFTALDIPQVDIAKLLEDYKQNKDAATVLADLKKVVYSSLAQNGNLVINCYYCSELLNQKNIYTYAGAFELDPCRGYPAVVQNNVAIRPWIFDRSSFIGMLDDEKNVPQQDALALKGSHILDKTPGLFRNLVPLQMSFLDRLINIMSRIAKATSLKAVIAEEAIPDILGTFLPYFYQDKHRTYYVRPELSDNGDFEFLYSDLENLLFARLEGDKEAIKEIKATIPKDARFLVLHHYFNFYHPLACYFMRMLFTKGIDGLMSRGTQFKGDIAYDHSPGKFSFKNYYQPTSLVYSDALNPVTYANGITDHFPGYPKDDVDFDERSGYSLYNWELFFHAPLLIAEQLDQNQQFDDADKWYKYIFNPTDASAFPSPDKYWVTKPFFINVNDKYNQQRIDNILLGVDAGDQALVKDVTDWRNNPFQPHYIAEYRTVAYQKTAVMKYLDHLIAWGDYYFTQDTMESVNEATQLYLLASQILGPKPQIIPPAYQLPVENYYQLHKNIDSLSNALVEIENLMPLQTIKGYHGVTPSNPKLPTLQTLYFCLPVNDQLLGYWDTVADRLFKIRHCLNIEGVFAPLALFAPPIDPGMLVRAVAAGLDFSSILNDLNSPLPVYRFMVMLQKATELTNEVKGLGAALLAVLEKKDAEALALLKSSQEISLLKAIMALKHKQVDDAQANLDGLNKQKELINIRKNYYQGLVSGGLNTGEQTAVDMNSGSTGMDAAIAAGYSTSGGLKLIPEFTVGAAGFGGSPTTHVQTGGHNFGNSAEDAAKTMEAIAKGLEKGASLAGTFGSYARRKDEWKFQVDVANKELEQIDKQIAGAQIKLDMSHTDVQNQQLQIDNAQAVDDYMHNKFTNKDLYTWMVSQISTVYFKGYNLAYATAKKAEQCFRYELAVTDTTYINFGYWDSLKKGLLSGEQLMYDLKKMEMDYYEENKREYELTKHISLAQLDAAALIQFKTNRDCWINLPEELFDMDCPGHYMRRIRSVSLTIPCIAGPYTSINCTLTLNKNSVRISSDASGTYDRKTTPSGTVADDPRFRDAIASIQSIATSSAQNDGGLFEVNFRDERYLPFEGAGAISLWRLQLSSAVQQFDYDTISDVILHVRYTAREGGDQLKQIVSANIAKAVDVMLVSLSDKGLARLFSAKNEFPTEWYAFLNPALPGTDQVLSLNLTADRFPFFAGKTIKINAVEIIADNSNNTALTTLNNIQVISPSNIALTNSLAVSKYGSFLSNTYNFTNQKPGTWKLVNSHSNTAISNDVIKDLNIILHYTV